MERDGLRIGHLVALVGAAVAVAALWLPFYELHLGQTGRAGFEQGLGQVPTPFAAFARGIFDQLDGLQVTAWQVFGRLDVAVAGGAGLSVLAILAAAGGVGSGVRVDPSLAARLAGTSGVVLGVLVTYRMVSRPAPDEVLALGVGGFVALAGCALMGAGGLLASGPRAPVSTPLAIGEVRPAATGTTSVAPPGAPLI